jgi:hypothetical protein
MTPAEYRLWFRPRLRPSSATSRSSQYRIIGSSRSSAPPNRASSAVLETDHENIHAAMSEVFEAATAFLRAEDTDRDAMMRAADRYHRRPSSQEARRHLEDEEI